MKNVSTIFVTLGAVSLLLMSACQKRETTQLNSDSLYLEMLDYAQYVSSLPRSLPRTKSGGFDDFELGGLSIDLSQIDDKYLDYIDMYSNNEDFTTWDESSVLALVNQDSRFSSAEKSMMAQSLAYAYAAKTDVEAYLAAAMTPEEQCLRNFKIAVRRALRNATVGALAALLEPGVVAETLVAVYLYQAIDDAEEDYENCINDIPVDENTGGGNIGDEEEEEIEDHD